MKKYTNTFILLTFISFPRKYGVHCCLINTLSLHGLLSSYGCPNSRHFENLPEINSVTPAVIYSDIYDLRRKIVRLIEDEEYRKKVSKAAERYVEEIEVTKSQEST